MRADPFDAYIEFKAGNKPEGESRDDEFGAKKACEIDKFSFGSSEYLPSKFQKKDSPTGGLDLFGDDEEGDEEVGDSAEKHRVRTFEIEKRIDTASPKLFQAYCSAAADIGDAIYYDMVTVSIRKPGDPPVVYLEIKFEKVYVSAYSLEINESDLLPLEKITFYFRKAEVNYTPIDATGAAGSVVTTKWSFS